MNTQEMEARFQAVENRVRELEDIEEIKKLQRAYGYYLEHVMVDEIVDCFADGPDTYMHWLEIGTWNGKEGIRRAFNMFPKSPEVLHLSIQCSGIVDVDPDGLRAMGRWYGWNAVAMPLPQGVSQHYEVPFYENEYVKQDGKWKIKVMAVGMVWVLNDPVDTIVAGDRVLKHGGEMPPDTPVNSRLCIATRYPNGYVLPFHYKHPVTGKDTYSHPASGNVYKVGEIQDWIPDGVVEP